ncbi:MAG: nucleotidyl transferase AbiEii/AbiGii toxin family protein [Hyphomonadaceae bacterium]
MVSDAYRAQVQLLVRVLPLVAEESCFALKGGTAINLFVRDMPRLSVDIDLAYLPVEDRPTSIAAIEAALTRIRMRIERGIQANVSPVRVGPDQELIRLLVTTPGAQIKIEVTPVLRGSVFPVEARTVRPRVEAAFGFAEMQVVSFADLYGGKIVAALDRQHPRDLFDVRDLLRNEGVDDALRQAFAVYLISHRRPMAEILTMRPKDITVEYERGFAGMTDEPVTLDELLVARTAIKATVANAMPEAHRRLILSVEQGEPDWTLLNLNGVEALPSVQWRLQNIRSLSADRRAQNVADLQRVIDELA